MRALRARARVAVLRSAAVTSWQGVCGVALVVGGAYRLAGDGWALVVAGLFMLLGAWATAP